MTRGAAPEVVAALAPAERLAAAINLGNPVLTHGHARRQLARVGKDPGLALDG